MSAERALQIALAVLDANPHLLERWEVLRPAPPASGVASWL